MLLKTLAIVAAAKTHLGISIARKPIVMYGGRKAEKDSLFIFDR